MEEILNSIAAAGYRQLEGKWVAVYRYDSMTESFPDMWRLREGRVSRRYRTLVTVDGLAGRVMREGKPILVSDTDKTEGLNPAMPAGIRSFGALPILSRGLPWGVMYVNAAVPEAFGPDEMEFLESLARQIGIFLESSPADTTGNVELSTVRVLAATVDAKDGYTRNHSTNVSFLARRLAREMSLDPSEVHNIDLAALLHDIGKIAIPDQILQKPGRLTAEERLVIQTHAAIGSNILAQASHLKHLVPLVRHHHEWFNGQGYPDRLAGNDIPLGASIIGLADAFDAMTSPRVYRPALPLDNTLAEIRRYTGTQFHPDVVEAFFRIIDKARLAKDAWLMQLGNAQETRTSLVATLEWHEVGATAQTAPEQERDPLDLLAEARILLQLTDLRDLLDHAGDLVEGFWMADAAMVYLVDRETNELVLSWSAGSKAGQAVLDTARSTPRITMSRGLKGWAVLTNQAVCLPDGRHDPRWLWNSVFDSPVSVLGVPIQAGTQTVGVIELVSLGESRFGRADIKVMKVFASILGEAINRVQVSLEHEEAYCTDALTGVRNANYLSRLLATYEAGEVNEPMCVVFLDGDDLKHFNDDHGHEVGNLMIQHIARCMRGHCRPQDVIIRYAGDEFLVFFRGLTLPEAADRIEQIRLAIGSTPVELPDGQRVYVTASCGVTEVAQDLGLHRAVRTAEQAMYNAKRTGKNRVWTAVF